MLLYGMTNSSSWTLQKECSNILHPCHAGDTASICLAEWNAQLLNQKNRYETDFDYYPEPE